MSRLGRDAGAMVAEPVGGGPGRWSAGRVLSVTATVVGWVVVGPLLLLALLRWVAWDRSQSLVLVNALSLYVYLPAWPVALLALLCRSWLLAGAAVVVVLAQILFVAPELGASAPVPADVGGAPSFRIFDANVYDHNTDMGGYAAQIRRSRPDVVTLEEASPEDELSLLRSGALTDLPYRVAVARQGPEAFVIASRFPISGAGVTAFGGSPYLVRMWLATPGGDLPLWVVHTTAPVGPGWPTWSGELGHLRALLARGAPGRLLVVGDFNADWGNRAFRAVLATGMVDGAAARGRALQMTWSQMLWVPPLVRIDHVLTRGGVVVATIDSAPGPGSDHRALVVRVALPRGRPERCARAARRDGADSVSAVGAPCGRSGRS